MQIAHYKLLAKLSSLILWRTFPGHGLADHSGSLRIRWLQSLQQTVCADLEKVAEAGENDDGKWIATAFNPADRLPMHAGQFGEAFLGQARLAARFPDISPDAAEDVTFCHSPMRTTSGILLTSKIRLHNYRRVGTIESGGHCWRFGVRRLVAAFPAG